MVVWHIYVHMEVKGKASRRENLPILPHQPLFRFICRRRTREEEGIDGEDNTGLTQEQPESYYCFGTD